MLKEARKLMYKNNGTVLLQNLLIISRTAQLQKMTGYFSI